MSIELPNLRQAFESWAKKDEWDYSLVRFDNGNYANYKTLMAWMHWQAAWQEAARLALEEAAKAVSEIEEPAWYGYENPNTFTDAIHKAEDAIRALAASDGGK